MRDERLEVDLALRHEGDRKEVIAGLRTKTGSVSTRESCKSPGSGAETYTIAEGAAEIDLLDKESRNGDLDLRCAHADL